MTNNPRPIQVLLAEDEKDVLQSLAIGLERLGFKVFSAKNGLEALQCPALEQVDIIVSDVRMPEMDGFTLFRKVREKSAQKPFLFISGHLVEIANEDADLARCPFLAKPFTSSELAKKIMTVLKSTPEFA